MSFYRTLYDSYTAVRQSSRLAGVRCTYGALRDSAAVAGPALQWLPTRDQAAAPVQAEDQEVQGGDLVQIESPLALWKGATLRLTVQDPGETAYPALERLLERVHLALADALDLDVNLRIGDGDTRDREGASSGPLVYELQIRVLVGVLDLLPTARVESTEAPGLQ